MTLLPLVDIWECIFLPLLLALTALWFQQPENKIKLWSPQIAILGSVSFVIFLLANYSGAHRLNKESLKSVAIAKQYLPLLKNRSKATICEFSGSATQLLRPYEFIPYPVHYLTIEDYKLRSHPECDLLVLVEENIPPITHMRSKQKA